MMNYGYILVAICLFNLAADTIEADDDKQSAHQRRFNFAPKRHPRSFGREERFLSLNSEDIDTSEPTPSDTLLLKNLHWPLSVNAAKDDERVTGFPFRARFNFHTDETLSDLSPSASKQQPFRIETQAFESESSLYMNNLNPHEQIISPCSLEPKEIAPRTSDVMSDDSKRLDGKLGERWPDFYEPEASKHSGLLQRRSLEGRTIPIRMGYAYNPEVLTQDEASTYSTEVAPEGSEERPDQSNPPEGNLLDKRTIPIRMGYAFNPEVKTQEDSPEHSIEKRTMPIGMNFVDNEEVYSESDSPKGHSSNLEKESLSWRPASDGSILPEEHDTSFDSPRGSIPTEEISGSASHQGNPAINLNTAGNQKTFTLPLFRPARFDYDSDVHPEIRFQQHLNHALQRHAHFLSKPLNDTDLIENLRQRAEGLDLPFEESNLGRRGVLIHRRAEVPESVPGYPATAFEAYKKSLITISGPPTAANSIGLSIEANDVGYFAEILVGTPPEKFKFILDSGSSDTWLPLPECRSANNSAESCNHPTLSASSSTFRRTNNEFKVNYGTGSVQGVLVEETMNLGGLILANHVFGGVTSATNDFSAKDVPFDGLMGTAKSILSNQKVLTPIEAMAKAGTLTGAFIGYCLGRVSDSENIGQVTFGGVDQTKFSGDLILFPNVNTKGFWEGGMDMVQVNGKTILTDRTGILDTGTTLIVAPASDAKAIHDEIPGSTSDGKGGYTIPCTSRVKVALSFGGVLFEINPVDLTFQPTTKNLAGMCISGISSGKIGGDRQWLIGDVFLKSVYFATDATNNQMGMALLNPIPSKA